MTLLNILGIVSAAGLMVKESYRLALLMLLRMYSEYMRTFYQSCLLSLIFIVECVLFYGWHLDGQTDCATSGSHTSATRPKA